MLYAVRNTKAQITTYHDRSNWITTDTVLQIDNGSRSRYFISTSSIPTVGYIPAQETPVSAIVLRPSARYGAVDF
jgi:hypothetical protein